MRGSEVRRFGRPRDFEAMCSTDLTAESHIAGSDDDDN